MLFRAYKKFVFNSNKCLVKQFIRHDYELLIIINYKYYNIPTVYFTEIHIFVFLKKKIIYINVQIK